MKKLIGVFIVVALVIGLLAGCNEIEKLKDQLIQQGNTLGIGKYKDKISYMIYLPPSGDPMIINRWDPFGYQNMMYFVVKTDESLGGKKYVKRVGLQVGEKWTEKDGIWTRFNWLFYSWEEIPKKQWKEEVGPIIEILFEGGPMGIIDAQRPLALELGLIDQGKEI